LIGQKTPNTSIILSEYLREKNLNFESDKIPDQNENEPIKNLCEIENWPESEISSLEAL
jgi:hypothetical protein